MRCHMSCDYKGVVKKGENFANYNDTGYFMSLSHAGFASWSRPGASLVVIVRLAICAFVEGG